MVKSTKRRVHSRECNQRRATSDVTCVDAVLYVLISRNCKCELLTQTRYTFFERRHVSHAVVRSVSDGCCRVATIHLWVLLLTHKLQHLFSSLVDPILTQTAWSTLSYSKPIVSFIIHWHQMLISPRYHLFISFRFSSLGSIIYAPFYATLRICGSTGRQFIPFVH